VKRLRPVVRSRPGENRRKPSPGCRVAAAPGPGGRSSGASCTLLARLSARSGFLPPAGRQAPPGPETAATRRRSQRSVGDSHCAGRPRHDSRAKAFAALLAPLLTLLFLGTPAPAEAQIARTFTPRFNTQTTGDVTLIGNTLMTCGGGGQCANALNGGNGNVSNQNFTMQYVDVDGDPTTFSSSAATLSLPAGATVLWAGLYWGGSSADPARDRARFALPGGAYANVTAQQLDALGDAYQGFLDVTAAVRGAGNGTYRVADVRSTPGVSDVWAGWGLIVVYHLDTALSRNLTVADGFVFTGPGNDVNLTIGGFLTPPTGTVQAGVGFLAWDGDLGHTGEDLILNSTVLSDPLNPANNVFNSTISIEGVRFSAKNPDVVNQLGFDADLLAANGVLGNGSTSATVTLKSASDRYFAGAIVFKTEIFVPRFDASNFRKTVVDLNGGAVRPGDVLEYTITARNVGTDAALQTVIRDTLAAGLTYVAGSLRVTAGPNVGAKTDAAGDDAMEYVPATRTVVARVGTGANATSGGQLDVNASTSIVFRAQVAAPAPTGTVVANQAALACIGQQLALPLTAVSDGDSLTAGEQPTLVTTTSSPITGTVFEDVRYGGGAGRSRAVAAGAAVAGVRVELYDASGNYKGATLTDAAGLYTLDGWAPGAYVVRAVNAGVRSTRPGSLAGLLPVQTFRTDAGSGTAAPVTDRVGGEVPSRADAAANTTGAPLASLASPTTAAQSVAPVTLGTATVGGVDFGFNFDTVVNANDAGQGSLRQFLLNANALGNAGLAQDGSPAGTESAVFMVSDGLAHPGLRAGLANLLIAGSVRIVLQSSLPPITDGPTRVDGASQTANVGDTAPGTLGAGAAAGVDALATATPPAPEVELRGAAGVALGLDVQAADVTLARLALLALGTSAGSDASALVRVGATAHRVRLEQLVLGSPATAFADPGAALRAHADLVRVLGAADGVVQDCLFGFGEGGALALTAGSDRWRLDGCTLMGNTLGHAGLGQLVLSSSGALVATRTRIEDADGAGVDAATATGGVALTNVTFRGNGRAGTGLTAGARLGGPGGTLDRCVAEANVGAGVQVVAGGQGWRVTHGSFAQNGATAPTGGGGVSGQVGIDLQSADDDPARGTPPYVTRNDAGDADAGGNGLVNSPVLEGATLANGQFSLSGWARPGAVVELYVTDGDPSGFGEGRTWLATFTEGSAADLDAGVTGYAPPVNGLDQGLDVTNRFRFTLAVPPGVAVGVALTATATLAADGTSEFSGRVIVGSGVNVSGIVYDDKDHDAQRDAGETGTGLALWAKLVASGAAAAAQVTPVAPTGDYAFPFVGAGAWTVVLDDSADPADLAPQLPPGWIGTQHGGGTLIATVNATDLTGQDFGLWHGGRVDGLVFRDDGAGGGVANDGQREGGETGLAARRVRLASAACAGGACDSTLTDGAGAFTLWLPAAAAGPVTVQQVNAPGWRSTGAAVGTTGGAYDRASDAIAWTAVPGVVDTGLQFGDVPPNLWAAPSALGVPGGTAALHRHTFVAGSEGQLQVTAATTPTPPVPGWTLTLWQDLDCDGALDPGEPPLPASLPLAAGQSLCVIARHQAPLGTSAGAQELATLTASFTYAHAVPALGAEQSLDDVTTVTLANGLVIAKSVDQSSAPPGSVLEYTITYLNPGTVTLDNIVIRDATPPWTTFESATCAGTGAGITGCVLSQQPGVGGTGPVQWTLQGALQPGGSGAVTFRVRVE